MGPSARRSVTRSGSLRVWNDPPKSPIEDVLDVMRFFSVGAFARKTNYRMGSTWIPQCGANARVLGLENPVKSLRVETDAPNVPDVANPGTSILDGRFDWQSRYRR